MKEFYIAPELNILCFAASEKLAADAVDLEFKDLLGEVKGLDDPVKPSGGDIEIEL